MREQVATDPSIVWVNSADKLRHALSLPQPLSIIVAFRMTEEEVREVVMGSCFRIRLIRPGEQLVVESCCIYVSEPGLYVSLSQDTDETFYVTSAVRTNNDILRSELQLFDIFNNTHDAIFVFSITPQGRFAIEMLNPAAGQLLGIPGETVIGRYADEVLPERVLRQLHDNLRNGLASSDFYQYEAPANPAPSDTVYHITILVTRDVKNRPHRMIALAQNITEPRRAMEEVNALNEMLEKRAAELAESNAELERFAFVSSHDLQEPLRIITSFLQLLKKRYGTELDETAQQYIAFAVDGAERMKRLISDLLEYSRLGSSKDDNVPVDLNVLLQEVLPLFSETISSTQATIDISHLPTVHGKKVQLLQLFQNLVSNALKYRSDDAPVIRISSEDEGAHWLFRVCDNGIGIDPKFHEKIFVIFQRLHSKTEYSGTGIGLAICKKIVERHGGKMWVEAAAGKGSCFCFTIKK